MRIKTAAGGASAAALVLALALGASACGRDDDNANNSNAARSANANTVTVATPSPTPVSTSEDTAIKNKTEANLSKAGITGVTVTVAGGEVTLKGDVASAKFQDAVKAANEA